MKVIFRADAGVNIGVGHIMRCLALAQALQEYGEIAFIMNAPDKKVEQILRMKNLSVFGINAKIGSDEDIATTLKCAENFEADWMVIDGYHFGPIYQKRVHENGIKVLLIDDIGGKGPYWTDIILNQNIHADEALYSNRKPYSELILGHKYALLRKEFTAWREWRREIPSIAHRILVTLGGSDKNNVTAKVIDALTLINVKDIEITVIAGQLNPHYQDISDKIASSNVSTAVKSSINNLAVFFANSDLVISAGGSTCYELAFMATPFATIVLAENQVEIANQFSIRGISVNMGWYESLSLNAIADCISDLIENQKMRYEMSRNGKGLVDGYGADRVVQAIVNHKSF